MELLLLSLGSPWAPRFSIWAQVEGSRVTWWITTAYQHASFPRVTEIAVLADESGLLPWSLKPSFLYTRPSASSSLCGGSPLLS